jgi:flagellar protein FliS
MSHNGHDAYLEGRILSADPIELVRILYHAYSDSVREARLRLADGDIAGRARAVSRAYDILTELLTSLDHQRGGEVSHRLGLLYDYMQRRLLEAHQNQADEPLAEIVGLVMTLTEAWAGVQAQSAPPEPAANPWGPMPPESEPAASHAWSW